MTREQAAAAIAEMTKTAAETGDFEEAAHETLCRIEDKTLGDDTFREEAIAAILAWSAFGEPVGMQHAVDFLWQPTVGTAFELLAFSRNNAGVELDPGIAGELIADLARAVAA